MNIDNSYMYDGEIEATTFDVPSAMIKCKKFIGTIDKGIAIKEVMEWKLNNPEQYNILFDKYKKELKIKYPSVYNILTKDNTYIDILINKHVRTMKS